MVCPRCRHDNPAGARFCNACGARLEQSCPACAHPNPPGSRFCSQCGHALAGAGAAPAPPPHLADRIQAARASLEGERKQVTVLFADLRGSMELLADRDPEEARRLLDPVLERMIEAVHRYEGTVNQVLGDGIMALFGAPVAHEDHAVRACYAALAIQEAVRRYAGEARRRHGIEVQVRVGLNSGEVVVRAIGGDLRMDYTAVGQTTHLAARMEQLATPGTIRLTAHTLALAEGFVHVVPLGPVPVKGLAEPVEVFELAGPAAARTRLQAAAARGLSRFVGRDVELDHLRRALEQAREGNGQIVAVVGEPGVGKSRLFWEFLHSHRTQGWLVLQASAASYGKALAYVPLADLLRGYFGISSGDDARTVRERITGKVLTLDETLRPLLPVFFALLEAPLDDAGWRGLDEPTRQRRVAEAVKRLLLRESREQPLVLVFEDLHWIDAGTQACVEALVDSLPAARLLVLVNYRPEYRHGWSSRTSYSQLRLDPLPPARADELLSSLLGEGPDLEPLKRLLVDRTGGTPFFLEECVRSLAETGVLAGARGAYRVARPVEAVRVPATVQALLASRIDRLPAEDKAVLQTAAVIGPEVPRSLLSAVSDLAEEGLASSLARLQTAEFLYEAALFPEVEYTFRHALTQEVAYGSLLQERRRALHARVVEVFESLHPARAGERAAWLAHHAFRGEAWGKAVGYLRRLESPDAVSLDAVLTPGPESPAFLWWTGEHDRAVRTGLRDAAVGADFGNFPLRVVSAFRVGQAYHSMGEYEAALGQLCRVVEVLEGDLTHEPLGMAGLPSVFARAWIAGCLAERGEFRAALAAGEEGLRIAESADHLYSVAVACFGLGTAHVLRGDAAAAVAVLERGLAGAQMAQAPHLVPLLAAPLGRAYALAGDHARAIDLLEHALERGRAHRFAANEPLRLTWLGQALLAADQVERAGALGEQAVELARRQGERGHEGWARLLEAEVAERRTPDDVAAVERAARQAVEIAEPAGMRPLLARAGLVLGAALARTARQPEAAAWLARGRALLTSLE
jgi:class 3 adenylate cyclase/tetratricopeptide (TPR) repeat protein